MNAVTPFYAAILGLLFVALSVRTLRLRRRLRVAIGNGDNPEMLRAIRVHANFAEYAPLTLLLVFMLESAGGSALVAHLLCICLVAGRVSHAFGVSRVDEDFRFRVAGMALTFTALAGAAIGLLVVYGARWMA